METFLSIVAKDLYKRHGADLSRVAVIFPNKRAGLFFNEHLAEEANRPIWSPAYLSISELFQQLSAQRSENPLKLGNSIKLVCELYKIFREETKSEETLDDFYFWGELLISDFDDADKNLVDADKLFSNLQDLKNIMDDFDFLNEDQEAAIRQFFQNFSIEKRTALKEKFISLWDVLGNIYHRYKEELANQQIAYEGMLYRSVIEQLDASQMKYDTYVFVGFNVLNKVETKFFQLLRDAGKALFYWDYDEFYTNEKNHEAGEFIRRNLKEFPSALSGVTFNKMIQPKKVRFVASSTENAQARFLPEWIRGNVTGKESESAVVLCNEALLLPVLHSIPDSVQHVNITMGFPLAQTPVHSFITALLELQTEGFRTDTGRYAYAAVQAVLKHPYTRQLSSKANELEKDLTEKNRFYPLPSELKQDDFLGMLFTPQLSNMDLCRYLSDALKEVATIYNKEKESDDVFNQLYRESLFKAYTLINRLGSMIDKGDLIVQTGTFKRLLNKVLSASNIPFHGEPAIGMQVMGVLETRNLDFKNLVMMSLNEGQLPKGSGDSSFIPYNLRKAFGMTTIEHKNAVYAYYFYRLMQRAENITLMYNTASDGLNRGEWSRFMLQFLIEWPHEIAREYLEAGQSPQTAKEIIIVKTPEVMKRLQNFYDVRCNKRAQFSPSALNTYMDCQLKFYYTYVAKLKPKPEVSSEIDSAMFGTIFHRSAELIYGDFKAHGNVVNKEQIEQLLHNDVKLQGYVDRAFKEEFFQVPLDEKPEYNGVQLVNSKVIASYIRQLLRNDKEYAPFTLVDMEKKVSEDITIPTAKGDILSRIGGTIDRMDSKDGTLRIVDYKTGGFPKAAADIAALFTPAENRPNYIFQTFLYAAIMTRQQKQKVAPSLLYIHQAASADYKPYIEIGLRNNKTFVEDFTPYEEEFRELLTQLLSDIFNSEQPFNQTKFVNKCEFCDFKALCKK
ncbi:PD-(D/E)XK nuclease superfamily protein [Bacteroides luti]|uniref:PD-(D/E)XK nuclease superfamily protein n=1 Tax=Bacteroides luti TaxID=1297750 RepID=A0A1M5EB96_9BACE|nr:PD-(D/E)XK nuclease family protein [Bacteroides luti]SHF76440.1 PD-(D/E)XK nuclease superfamily protein [Bacteroides luti]